MDKKYRPWLRALSGLSINFSAAWLVLPFIGSSVSFPQDILDFLVLTLNIVLGIIFLLLTVLIERRLEE